MLLVGIYALTGDNNHMTNNMSVLKIKGDKIEVERPDGGKHTGQAAMLHFAFRQNAATIKNS